MGHPSRLQLWKERAASVTSCNVSSNVYFFLNYILKATLSVWMQRGGEEKLLQLLAGPECGSYGLPPHSKENPEVTGKPSSPPSIQASLCSCAAPGPVPRGSWLWLGGLWGLSLASQTSHDHPSPDVSGIILGIVSCTPCRTHSPVYSMEGGGSVQKQPGQILLHRETLNVFQLCARGRPA